MKKIGCGTILLIVIVVAIIGSFFRVDINDEEAVIKDMQGTWIGYEREAGLFIHYRLAISGNNFKGWMQTSYTNDEPNWNSQPNETGTFKLSPVQVYTNSTGKFRNINFYKYGGGYGDNSLAARSFSNAIIYDDGGGLYVVSWGSMKKK